MIELAAINPGDICVDLGSGDGSVCIEAAKAGAYAIGVEINPFLVLYSRWRIKRNGLRDKIKIMKGDIMGYPLQNVDVICMYLMPNAMNKLQSKIFFEAKIGARIVSHAFPFQYWKPIKEFDKVFLYRIGSTV